MRFGLMRRYCSEHAAHAKRLIAKLGAQPIVTPRSGVTFIEDEIYNFEHR